MATGDLTTLANVKAWFAPPLTTTADDALLTRLVTAASQFIQAWLGRTVAATAYGYAFARGQQNVTVAYTAGYAATPPDIEQACIELVALRYKERDRIGQVSKNLAGEVVSFAQKDMPADVQTLLDQYRSVVPA